MTKIISILALFFGGLIMLSTLTSSSGGRASAANEGNTGAPGDNNQTCISCHNGGPIQASIEINITDSSGNTITDYIPETIYDVEVLVTPTAGTPLGYGFQLVCLADANNTGLPGWQNPESNVKITSAKGRSYAEHNDVTTNNSFKLKWKAPAAGTGSITFYSSGNAVNKNSATSGDGAAKTSLSLGEDVGPPASVEYLNFALPKVYPTQTSSNFFVNNFDGNLQIFNLSGKLIQNILVNQANQVIDFSNEKTGLYILKFTSAEGNSFSQKVVKI